MQDGNHSSPPHQGEAERTQIKSEDDLKLNGIEAFEAQEALFEPPVIIWRTEFVTALAVSATLAALMKGAGGICIDKILEEVNYRGARCHQVKESEFDCFDMLMRQAASEIKPLVCEALTLGLDVKLNYAANVYLFPPGRAISGHGRPLLVVPIERDQISNHRVIFHSIDQHPEPEGDEIAWPSSVQNKCLVYLLSREGCMTVLYNTVEFMSITYLWKYGGLVSENLEQKNIKLETESAVS